MREKTAQEEQMRREVRALRRRVAELERDLDAAARTNGKNGGKSEDDGGRQLRRLAQQNARLQAQNAELKAFAHTVAHELKAPLSGMLGFGEIVLADAPLDEAAREQMVCLLRYGAKMEGIIDAFLLLAELDGGKDVECQPLAMADVVAGALERITHHVEEMEAEIVHPAGAWPVALGYAPWVEEVWVNYLSNALKYGGCPPRVELGADPSPAGEAVRFWVKDNGAGLTPQQQRQLFTPFRQLHDDTPLLPGHGLGLSIVQRIVHRLGGDVSCHSEEGEGSTFAFTLPAA